MIELLLLLLLLRRTTDVVVAADIAVPAAATAADVAVPAAATAPPAADTVVAGILELLLLLWQQRQRTDRVPAVDTAPPAADNFASDVGIVDLVNPTGSLLGLAMAVEVGVAGLAAAVAWPFAFLETWTVQFGVFGLDLAAN